MADFVLGRLKFKWRGDWAVSTAYLIDDIVKYGGNTYVVTANHTSQSTIANFYTDLSASKYSLHSESLFFKGNWAASTFYRLNDLVKFGAFQYRCILQHTSASTFAIGSNWQVFTEGLQFEDSYSSSTEYQDGDVVTYGGYTYVYVNSTPSSGNTPTDNSYWDVVTTGFNNTGDYVHATTYKTGDVVRYGGNSYVANANAQGNYPANTNGTTNSSYWDLLVKGFDYQSAAFNSATLYNIGDVVRYVSSSYVMLKDRQTNVTPGTDATVWQLIAQGDTGAVTNTRGDIIFNNGSQATRLAIGTSGSVLTTDGSDPVWSNAEGKNVYYVSNSGSDSNDGSQYLPFKTVNYALSQATSGDIVDFNTITGGTGGTPGTYDIAQTGTDGSGSGARARVILDGSSTPTVTITNGGSGHAAGDVITFSNDSSQLGGASSITITVVSASVGDVIYIKNGVYRENLPLRIKEGVTVQGESLRGTEIRPASSTGSQVKTVSITTNVSGATNGTYNHVHANATNGDGIAASFVANVVVSGGAASSVTIYNGGTGFAVGNTITIPAASVGNGGNLVLTVASLQDNNASNMFLMNNTTNLVQMSMKGLTGTPTGKGTGKAAVVSLDPSGSITTASPYVQNCSSVSANATGVEIDGNLHSAGNKSILANDFTQINSDGRGVHALAGGRGEMVSIFTYYCDKSFYAESGGFIRGLNCSSAYGEKGAEATGTLASETAVSVVSRGEMLKYSTTGFVGAATESDIQDTVTTSEHLQQQQ
nr:phage tail fiber-like protein [uncultured Mediterranean phage uvMED]